MAAEAFFDGWMATWSRKIFIAKVLRRVTPEWTRRALRNRLRRLKSEIGDAAISKISAAGKTELKEALLAIDSFPRRALLLTAFEKLSPEDVAVLLSSDPECVQTGAAIGLIELTRNLAPAQHNSVTVWAPSRHDSGCRVPVF